MKERLEQINQGESTGSQSFLGRLENQQTKNSLAELEKRPRETNVKNKNLPRLTFDFLFAAHVTPRDLEKSKKIFEEADIVVMEGQASPLVRTCFQEVSDGDLTPKEALQKMKFGKGWPEWLKPELEWIAGTKKKIFFIEKERPLAVFKKKLNFRDDPKVTFEEGIHELDTHLREWTEESKERESEMLKKMRPEEIIKKFPDLKDKKELRVGMWAGAIHTPLAHALKMGDQKINIRFSRNPFLYSFMHESIRRYRFNKPVDEDLQTKAFGEFLVHISNYRFELDKLTADTAKIFAFIRMAISHFNEDEIKELYSDYHLSRQTFFRSLKEKLSARGIKFPESEKEIDDILKKLNPSLFPSKDETDNSPKNKS